MKAEHNMAPHLKNLNRYISPSYRSACSTVSSHLMVYVYVNYNSKYISTYTSSKLISLSSIRVRFQYKRAQVHVPHNNVYLCATVFNMLNRE